MAKPDRFVQIPLDEYNAMRDEIIAARASVGSNTRGVTLTDRKPAIAAICLKYGVDGELRVATSDVTAALSRSANVQQFVEGDEIVLRVVK